MEKPPWAKAAFRSGFFENWNSMQLLCMSRVTQLSGFFKRLNCFEHIINVP
jgi:hypothetical protein